MELRIEDQKPPAGKGGGGEQPVGRWWSGQQDDEDEDTLEDQARWAEEPTEEREPQRERGLFKRRPGDTPHRPPR